MNRICGYSCEHNKGGVCQITMCDKQIYITTKTDEPLQKQLEKYTKYKIQKDENFELRKIHELQQELQRKDKTIQIMENYLELIYDLGYDHDGCETTGDLVCLMDELVRYASLGRACNTTETIYVNGNKKYNILHEEIESGK